MKLGFSLPMAGAWATPDNLHDSPQGKDRRPLWGTIDEIREDVQRYAAEGLTELFLEANFDPRGPSLEPALRVMEALAPAGNR